MKKILALVLTLMMVFSLVSLASAEEGKTYTIGICNFVDDASLNQIIANIRERLGYAGANLSIASQPEKGTVATIIVPKTKTEENEHADIRAGR